MAIEFKLPELGEKTKSGDIVKVLVAVGDVVAKDQPILEMETDKAVIEVPSSVAGTVTAVHVKAGQKASVGQLILTLNGDSEAAPQAAAKDATQPPAAARTLAPAPAATPATSPTPTPPPPAPALATSAAVPVAAAPSVRLFAREIGIDIVAVPGSGPDGRISIDDVKRYAKQLNTSRAAAPGAAVAPVELPDFGRWGEVEHQPISNIRRKTAEHMAAAWATIPHVTQHDRADITELESLRKRFAPKAEAAGGKLTVTAIVLKIVAAALKVFPKFAASIDMASGEVILKKYYHIGVAVDTERGLLVPVIRNVDQKNIITLAVELGQMAAKARNGKLSIDEMTGGTFTVTNLGGIGGSFFTPIINAPEVAILGMGRSMMEPSFGGKDGCCQPRVMLPLSLSYDHRLIDGADGARFLRWIVEAIEEPLLIPLEG